MKRVNGMVCIDNVDEVVVKIARGLKWGSIKIDSDYIRRGSPTRVEVFSICVKEDMFNSLMFNMKTIYDYDKTPEVGKFIERVTREINNSE
jgi:hypothetical protein